MISAQTPKLAMAQPIGNHSFYNRTAQVGNQLLSEIQIPLHLHKVYRTERIKDKTEAQKPEHRYNLRLLKISGKVGCRKVAGNGQQIPSSRLSVKTVSAACAISLRRWIKAAPRPSRFEGRKITHSQDGKAHQAEIGWRQQASQNGSCEKHQHFARPKRRIVPEDGEHCLVRNGRLWS